MSGKRGKQVGKQVVKRRYRRVRYDLVVVGLVLVIAGILVYNIVSVVHTPGSEGAKIKEPSRILKGFISLKELANASIMLVYKIRGYAPAASYTLGTLDYVNIVVRKDVIARNETTSVSYRSFIYTTQGPLFILAEIFGLAFASESFRELFFNPLITSTWSNLSIERYSVENLASGLLGEVIVEPQVYRYCKIIDEMFRCFEVRAFRAVEFELLPIKIVARVNGNEVVAELVNVVEIG